MKSDGHLPLDAADTGLGSADDGLVQEDPYQLETMVLPRAVTDAAAEKAQLSALLDTHIMSRDAMLPIRNNPWHAAADRELKQTVCVCRTVA